MKKSVTIRMAWAAFWGILLLMPILIQAQDVADSRRRLQQIQREISDLQSRLESSQSTLSSTLQRVATLEQQIGLQQEALRLLRGEISRTRGEITRMSTRIDTLEAQTSRLKAVFARQIRFTYKFQQGRQLEWLLGADNLNQALVRLRYFQTIARSVRGSFDRLTAMREELATLRESQQQELAAQQTLERQRTTEQRTLMRRRDERRSAVEAIRRDSEKLEQAIAAKRASFAELNRLIQTMERERGSGRRAAPEVDWSRLSGDFGAQRGKLNWPVPGRIVHPFGRYQNPNLKTVLISNGIDIAAEKGEPVRCVFPGVASLITYMTGFGNTVIVDHNKGYYTVYAHLDEITVGKFQMLEAGDVIGTVGETGSLEGAMLHFEIYGDNKPLNPQQWLISR